MKIEHTKHPSPQDINFLREMIDVENPDKDSIYEVGFFIRNDEDKIIAGCNCFVLFGAIHIDQVWVHKLHRRQGLGRSLLETVHSYGREAGCTIATVTTMTFQRALGFYEIMGYSSDFM